MLIRSKIISGFVVMSLIIAPLSPTALAKSEELNLEACAKTYTSDFVAFMETIIGFHGFGDNFTEYWKDIFGRNKCHSYDILMLDNQLDKVKKQIQTAYLNCKTEKVPKLEIAYYKTDAEIYYARHVVNTPFISFRGLAPAGLGYKDLNEAEKEKLIQSSLANRSTLFNEMMDKYSEKVGGESEFKKLFNDIEIKYADRKKTYVICEGGGWEDVKAKIDEMIENWGGVEEGIEALERDVGGAAAEVKRAATDNPPENFGDFLGNTFGMAINGLPPEQGIDQIIGEIKGYMPSVGTGGSGGTGGGTSGGSSTGGTDPTVSDVFKTAVNESERYQAELRGTLLRAKYEALYMGATDAGVVEFLNALNEFQMTLLEGMIYIGETFKCTEKMADRQC